MSTGRNIWVEIPLGCIFLAISVGAGWLTKGTIKQAQEMRTWQATPGQVIACDLKVQRDSKNHTTYQVQASCRYHFKGVSYTTERVSLHRGFDNIGSYHQHTHALLKRHQQAQSPMTCWVNPKNPSEAILFRRPRLEKMVFAQLFVLVFGTIGALFLLNGIGQLWHEKVANSAMGGVSRITMRGARTHRSTAAVALAINAYLGWFFWALTDIFQPDPLSWYVWLLALVGVGLLAVAAFQICKVRKFGISVFEMSPCPAVSCETVSGTVKIPAQVVAPDGFEATLQCIHQFRTHSGKHSRTVQAVLWETSTRIDGGYTFGIESLLPIRFALPENKPATTAAGGRNGYFWWLRVTAATPGIDYKALFDVPISATHARRGY